MLWLNAVSAGSGTTLGHVILRSSLDLLLPSKQAPFQQQNAAPLPLFLLISKCMIIRVAQKLRRCVYRSQIPSSFPVPGPTSARQQVSGATSQAFSVST